MKLETLTSYGILPAFVDRWRATIGDRLLDWQADALRHYGLLDGPKQPAGDRNLLVVAPTSSGKTFIGEMAAAAALSRRRKVIFIVPLKAIAAEKHAGFEETFGALGFRAVISTRDHQQFDRAFTAGDFDLAIVVAEKLRHLLVQKIDLLAQVDLIVADELHLLTDPDRGPALLSVIEKLVRSTFDCRFIGLSTRLPAAEFLADYLHARIMRVCRRPVELRRGVLCDGTFTFREDNSGDTGSEQLGDPGDHDDESLLRLLGKQLDDGEQILVFGKTKIDCHHRAAALARRRTERRILEPAAAWTLQAGGPVVGGLSDWYERGIGVHHADLSFAQRRLTEQLFREGKLRILFCTGTLAMGVNLPSSIVYVEAERFTGGRYGNTPLLAPLETHEFDNAAGRAGRLGLTEKPGRAILWADTPVAAQILWQTYINPSHNDDTGQLQWPDINRRLLEAIACGLITDHVSCAAHFNDDSLPVADIESRLDYLRDCEMLAREADLLRATPAGIVAAASGVSPQSIGILRELVAQHTSPDPVTWTAAALALPESADVRWPRRSYGPFDPTAARWREQFGDDFESTLARVFPGALRPEIYFPRPHQRRRAMAAALAIGDWATGELAEALGAAHQAPPGRFERTAETISWLVDTAAALAETDPQWRAKAPALRRSAFEIRSGLPWCLHELAGTVERELPRDGILQLARLGWDKPHSLVNAQARDLEGILPAPVARQVIARACRWVANHSAKRQNQQDKPSTLRHKEVTMPGTLTLNGRRVRSRFAVELGERTCALRAKSFKYLFSLAVARRLRGDGWIDKRDIEAGENQIKYFYQLRQELKAAYEGAQRLIENDGAGRYRLALSPETIRFDIEQIAAFPDWEIQQAARQLQEMGIDTQAA